MYQLIVNADDFGRHILINKAVANAVETGFLRSATLMAGGIAFDDAVCVAKGHSKLGVGIHFTLVNGNPLLPADEIPSLVDENGDFYDNYGIFVKRFLSGKINIEEVGRELSAQLNKIERTGLHITHFDSHQHMHVLPSIIDVTLDLAAKAGIRAMRVSKTPIMNDGFFSAGVGSFIGRCGLFSLAKLAERKAKMRGFFTPNHFDGIVAGGAVTENVISDIIKNIKTGTTEIMIHPGTDNIILQRDCQWEHDFVVEFSAVTSKKILTLLKNRGIKVVDFLRRD